MPTQRTKTGQGSNQPGQPMRPKARGPQDDMVEQVHAPDVDAYQEESEQYVEDLGIPDGVDDDPTGYVPPTQPQMIAGRQMRPMRPQDLEEAHRRYAGNVNMVGDKVPGEDDGMRTEVKHDPNAARMAEAYRPGAVEEARRLMPQQFVAQPSQQQQQQQAPQQRGTMMQEAQTAQVNEDAQQEVSRVASAFEYLKKVENEAKASGSTERASQTTMLIGALKEDYKVEEAKTTPGRHPILQRLVEHFGLEKIKAAEVEWCGFKWRFAPTNTKLDLWIGDHLTESGYNAASLLLSASVVGIDGEPVYKVLRVPLSKTYTITDKKGLARKEVVTPIYEKTCMCGSLVPVDAEVCAACGSAQDVYFMPTDLRIACAVQMNRFFEENFGVYEELAQLVQMRDELMKNRLLNKEELYPFLPKKPSS